jgi:hypothetical protein
MYRKQMSIKISPDPCLPAGRISLLKRGIINEFIYVRYFFELPPLEKGERGGF